MSIIIDGKKYYRTAEALKKIGLTKATFLRWVKKGRIEDVRRRDIRNWRLFNDEDIERIKRYAHTIDIIDEDKY